MARMRGPVLLVGSVPGVSAADALLACANGVGDLVSALPDGETGYRSRWIHFLFATVFHGNPALSHRATSAPDGWQGALHVDEYDKLAEEGWRFRVKETASRVHFDHLGYAAEARRSYVDFSRLRANGVIPLGVRFQVALPSTESAVRACVASVRDYELIHAAYEEAMKREIAALVAAIPADDLIVQWDINLEILAIGLEDRFGALASARGPI